METTKISYQKNKYHVFIKNLEILLKNLNYFAKQKVKKSEKLGFTAYTICIHFLEVIDIVE